MIRDARLFFEAVSLGFLMPALVVGAALYWASDRPPLPAPFPGNEAGETSFLAVSGNAESASTQTPLQSSPPPPVVAIVTGSLDQVSRTELTAKIQAQLRRIGCLRDAVDGTWNAATSAATRSFVEDRQLGMPTDEPNSLLLLLLEADNSNWCVGSTGASLAGKRPVASAEVLISAKETVGALRVDPTGSAIPAASAEAGGQPDASKQATPVRRSPSAENGPRSTFSELHNTAP